MQYKANELSFNVKNQVEIVGLIVVGVFLTVICAFTSKRRSSKSHLPLYGNEIETSPVVNKNTNIELMKPSSHQEQTVTQNLTPENLTNKENYLVEPVVDRSSTIESHAAKRVKRLKSSSVDNISSSVPLFTNSDKFNSQFKKPNVPLLDIEESKSGSQKSPRYYYVMPMNSNEVPINVEDIDESKTVLKTIRESQTPQLTQAAQNQESTQQLVTPKESSGFLKLPMLNASKTKDVLIIEDLEIDFEKISLKQFATSGKSRKNDPIIPRRRLKRTKSVSFSEDLVIWLRTPTALHTNRSESRKFSESYEYAHNAPTSA